QAGFLESLLGNVEIAEVAQQGGHGLRTRRGQRRVDPGEVVAGLGHAPALPGQKFRSGRISYEPPGLARPSSLAVSSACSSEWQSITKKPSNCSFVSANGPSMTSGGSRSLRSVVAAVVGTRRATGPSRPCLASFSVTVPRLAMTAASSSLFQEQTVASSL